MSTSPTFSVIIPAYNRAALLRQSLESVFQQNFRDIEVIVVDDGSTDDFSSIIAEFGPRVTFLRQSNSGPGAARNIGATAATGEYLAFLDSDDLWFPWTLSTYANVIAQAAAPSFFTAAPFRFRDVSELLAVTPEPLQTEIFSDYYASSDAWRWFGASSFIVRRSTFNAVQGFHGARINGEDADLAMRLGVSSSFVSIVKPVTFAYREHDAQVTLDVLRSVRGVAHLLHEERAGRYPGGAARIRERQRIITRHVRPVSLEALQRRDYSTAFELYTSTFWWHVTESRFRYLLGLPALAVRRLASR
jgi:hypothetical protein